MPELLEEAAAKMLAEHKRWFERGETRDVGFRLRQLAQLKAEIKRRERQIIAALHKDLRKSEFEAYATEIGFILDSIGYMQKYLRRWAKPVKVRSPLHMFPASSRILSEPYGTVLIIGPFNYPFQLLLEPLIGAIAAGNCAVLKPSEHTPSVSAAIEELIGAVFPPQYVRVVQGEKETTGTLIHADFDYIFFTGSVPVGRIVMEAAAQKLVPVTLELGGKSPVIVDASADLDNAARRIVWGKLINVGQTCIAPDYVLVQEAVAEQLVSRMKHYIQAFFGPDIQNSPDYGRMVNLRQLRRVAGMIEQDRAKIAAGGTVNEHDLYIEPTLLFPAAWSDAAMEDEIFGPVLPVLTYSKLDEAIAAIHARPKPLALYLFTQDKETERRVLRDVSFGGGCINDTITHVASTRLPFGGVGNAGIGAYHGKHSFELFSHRKSVVKRGTKLDLGIVYPPYRDKVKIARRLLK